MRHGSHSYITWFLSLSVDLIFVLLSWSFSMLKPQWISNTVSCFSLVTFVLALSFAYNSLTPDLLMADSFTPFRSQLKCLSGLLWVNWINLFSHSHIFYFSHSTYHCLKLFITIFCLVCCLTVECKFLESRGLIRSLIQTPVSRTVLGIGCCLCNLVCNWLPVTEN